MYEQVPKRVLISINPKWCNLIKSGKKTIEVRKSRPKLDLPFRCYIYESYGRHGIVSSTFGSKIADEHKHGCCKVIGEFTCDKIIPICFGSNEKFFSHTEQTGLTEDEVIEYFGKGKAGYGWHITDLRIYYNPTNLGVFGVTRPPQSWCYVKL